MKKILVAIVIVALAGAVGVWQFKKHKLKVAAAAATYVTAVKGPIEQTVDATGEVSPLNRVEIKPPIAGRIEQLLVDEGAHVKAGEILAWMSSSDRAAILDAALAQGPDVYKHWQDAYKPTPIVAPLSGVIILRNVVVGQTVDSSIVLYAMSDKLIVVAQVDEADIGKVKKGLPARITLDAYPDHTIDGSVAQILYEGKNVSNVITYDVKIEPKNAPAYFRSQMTANVNLILSRQEDAVLIPNSAVHDTRSGDKIVMVPGEDGKPVRKEVEVGLQSGENVQILSGLSVGDRVLVTRAHYAPQKAQQTSPLNMGGPSGGGRRGGGH